MSDKDERARLTVEIKTQTMLELVEKAKEMGPIASPLARKALQHVVDAAEGKPNKAALDFARTVLITQKILAGEPLNDKEIALMRSTP
jgi:hypothetical protein